MDLTNLIAIYRGPLIGLLASWGVPWREASELAEDSFAVAWLNRAACCGDWADPPTFGRWLRGVARNRHRNWARSRGRWRRRFVPLELTEADGATIAPEATEIGPADEIIALRRAIDRLPGSQRQVILMHYLEETSVIEVAALLGITPKAVEGRLFQARRRLRELLADQAPRTLAIGRCLLW